MKALITSLLFTLMSPLAIAAGTIKVYSPDSTQPKTLTDAPFLIDLVGQPRLANSWWPGAVISEGKATVIAKQRHQALLARLGALASEEEGDDAAAINSVRRQLQAVKVTGRQRCRSIRIGCASNRRPTARWKASTPCGWDRNLPR